MVNDRDVAESAYELEVGKSAEEENLTLELILDGIAGELNGVKVCKDGVGIVDEAVPTCPQTGDFSGCIVDAEE